MAIDLNQPFVGYYIEFFDLDVSPIYGSQQVIQHFAPSVDYDDVTGVSSAYTFQGNTYLPVPCKLTGVSSKSEGAPGTPTFTISNLQKTLLEEVTTLSGLVGAKLTRHRTFSESIATGDELPVQTFIISQALEITRQDIKFKLNLPIDFEGARLPFRTVLKDEGFPGVTRAGSRLA